jgi:hypothetical protein
MLRPDLASHACQKGSDGKSQQTSHADANHHHLPKALMDISVIICNRNRAASLDRVLASALEMNVPDIKWELLIVDNGSGDDVGKVVHRYKSLLPVRVERQDKPGLSWARNCGVMIARGKHVIWTDDDVVLDRRWLLAYSDAIRFRPDACVFGGKIIPVLELPCAVWFRQNLDILWELTAARDFGPEELPLSVADGRVPFGANYAALSKPFAPDGRGAASIFWSPPEPCNAAQRIGGSAGLMKIISVFHEISAVLTIRA